VFSTRSSLGAPLPESPEYHSRANYACGILGASGWLELVAGAGVGVPVWLGDAPVGCWTVSGDPAGVAEGVACCANAQTAEEISTNHRSNRKELSPNDVRHSQPVCKADSVPDGVPGTE
jgi:hypothetical protein